MRPINELFVEITHRCLLNCIHCSSEATESNQNYISFEKIRRLIDETLPMGLRYFALSGGEPLLHPEVLDIIAFSGNRSLETCLYTSGVLGSKDQQEPVGIQMMQYLRDIGLKRIVFSVQGATAGVHDRITDLAGSFELVMTSIRNAVEVGHDVEIHFVPMLPNYHEHKSILALAETMGIRRVSYLRLVPQGRASGRENELCLSNQKANELWSSAEKLNRSHSIVAVRLGSPFNCIKKNRATKCSAGQNKLLISATGEVFPCEAFKHCKGNRPNIFTLDAATIWDYDGLLAQLRKGEIPEKCSFCEVRHLCSGGCPGQRMVFHGNMGAGPDPWCTKVAGTC